MRRNLQIHRVMRTAILEHRAIPWVSVAFGAIDLPVERLEVVPRVRATISRTSSSSTAGMEAGIQTGALPAVGWSALFAWSFCSEGSCCHGDLLSVEKRPTLITKDPPVLDSPTRGDYTCRMRLLLRNHPCSTFRATRGIWNDLGAKMQEARRIPIVSHSQAL
jgi:hypothetical protein